MDSQRANEDVGVNDVFHKAKCLSNGSCGEESSPEKSEVKLSVNVPENGLACNGVVEKEGGHDSCGTEDKHVAERHFNHGMASISSKSERSDRFESVIQNIAAKKASKSFPQKDFPESSSSLNRVHGESECSKETMRNSDTSCENLGTEASKHDCDMRESTDGALPDSKEKISNKREVRVKDVRHSKNTHSTCVDSDTVSDRHLSPGNESVTADRKLDVQPSEIGGDSKDKNNMKGSKKAKASDSEKSKEGTEEGVACLAVVKDEDSVKNVQINKTKKKKKKIGRPDPSANAKEITSKHSFQTSQTSRLVAAAGLPSSVSGVSHSYASANSKLPAATAMNNPPMSLSPAVLHGLPTGYPSHGIPALPSGFAFHSGVQGQGSQSPSMFVPSVAPPKPKSSLDQIELIRWEIQNRINTRPKYFKPNPASELGPLAKFLFDIGSDLIKESVYHDLVKIQCKKNGDDKLGVKEREDLEKLKEIEKDLFATIGHLKLKLKLRCKMCNFQTESNNVMYLHKQYPHEDNKLLRCSYCLFSTRQIVAFKFHIEAEHAVQPKLHDKKAFYECDLCPYENNQEQKLTVHKQRCAKQFRPLFNLHPSCLSGAEINLCLENIFYKPVIPKNFKLLQQKHVQQQAALAEARRQQAEVQALAAQKNAAAVAARKQQQSLQKRAPGASLPRYNVPAAACVPFSPKVPGHQQAVRYNAASQAKGPRPAVPSMVNDTQNSVALPASRPGNAPAGGFEVCEICGGYVKDRKALRIHFFYAHRIDLPFNLFERNQAPLYCATCYVRFWTAQGLRKHIDTHKEENQIRGVVGKCISCGHHVLNLLLHMRVVHSRELQHYISALMCMFCGGHFESRQDCERHILKVHGHVDPVTGTLKSNPTASVQPQLQKPAANQKRQTNNTLVKGSVCVLCNLNFGRNVDLTRHCMRMHHTCMKCGMVVIDKASLLKHTCLSSPSGTRDCSMCGEVGFHPAYYVKHLRDNHLKKFSVKVSKLGKNTIERWTKRPCPFKESEVPVEISDEDGDASIKKIRPPSQTNRGKRPRIGPACKIGRVRENGAISDKSEPEVAKEDSSGLNLKEAEDSVKEEGESTQDPHSKSSPGDKRKSAEELPDTAPKRLKPSEELSEIDRAPKRLKSS